MPMPSNLFLKGKTSGDVKGGCTIETLERKDSILVQALSHNINIPHSPQTGQPTGKRVHGELTITKEFDKSSPILYDMLCSGERTDGPDGCVFKFYQINVDGEEELYFTIKLEDAIIVDIKAYYPNCLDASLAHFKHMEDVSFTYRKITWRHELESTEADDDWKNAS